jgi:hypothetical protein
MSEQLSFQERWSSSSFKRRNTAICCPLALIFSEANRSLKFKFNSNSKEVTDKRIPQIHQLSEFILMSLIIPVIFELTSENVAKFSASSPSRNSNGDYLYSTVYLTESSHTP